MIEDNYEEKYKQIKTQTNDYLKNLEEDQKQFEEELKRKRDERKKKNNYERYKDKKKQK
jgi:hypothetical protein